MKTFDYHRPETLKEVISLLVHYTSGARLLAGGTDMIVEMKKGGTSPKAIVDLKNIQDLSHLKEEKEDLRIGALVTIREIETSSLIKDKFPILAETARVMASFQVRNRATLGGNICHASPAADMVPPLIGLGGKVRVVGGRGEKVIELEEFFLGPGRTKLEVGEVLKEVIIPKQSQDCKGIYLKLSPRKLADLAVVGIALVYWESPDGGCKDVRIVMGAVAPKAIRAREAERRLVGGAMDEGIIREAAEMAMGEASPITDVRGMEWYRREMVKVLVERGLRRLCRI